MGGVIEGTQFLFAPRAARCMGSVLVMTRPGFLEAQCSTGEMLWSRRYVTNASLWSLVDLDGNGSDEFLTYYARNQVVQLDVFDVATGEHRWFTSASAANLGGIAVGDLNADGRPELVWFPAGTSDVRAFTFRDGYGSARLLWNTETAGYTSDPYTPSLLAIEEATAQQSGRIIVCGGRGETSILIIDGGSGIVRARQSFVVDPSGQRITEAGGIAQMLALRDANGDGRREIVTVALWPSTASYMFQGAIVADPDRLFAAMVVDQHPYGWEFVTGSLRDGSGDGKADLVMSRFDPSRSQFVLAIIDLETLRAVAVLEDARLRGIVETRDGPLAIVQSGNRDETVRNDLPLHAVRIGAASLTRMDWNLGTARLLTGRPVARNAPDLVNPGPSVVTADVNGDLSDDFLLHRSLDGKRDVIDAIDGITGETLRRFDPSSNIDFATATGDGAGQPVMVAFPGGRLGMMNPSLTIASSITIGGFYRPGTGNYHVYDPAIATDLDGDGAHEIYAKHADGSLVRVDAVSGAMQTVSSNRYGHDPVGMGGSLLFRACGLVPNSLCAYELSSRRTIWQTELPSGEQRVPLGANAGRFGAGEPGFVVAGAPPQPVASDWIEKSVMMVYALGLDGRILWTARRGPWYDATLAVADFNGDGIDDVLYNYQLEKGRLLNGVDGREMAASFPILPVYDDLGNVDYAGAPVILDVDDDAIPEFLNVEDDAHTAMFRWNGTTSEWTEVWIASQASLDDERWQMPAAAPYGKSAILGCATESGLFVARHASTGETLWRRTLIPLTSATGTALTDSIALDVNGDARQEFVVGGVDGQLRALDAASGTLLWSIDLGAPLSDPIAADVDGDGFSEIVVATADGWLNVISQAGSRRRAVAPGVR